MRARRRSLPALAGSAGLMVLLCSAAVAAPSPVGNWLVANKKGMIRIVDCSGAYWGVVAWEQTPGGKDTNNPNPALRNRPTLGIPILLGMSPAPGQGTWNGQIYNSQDGRTYGGHISLNGPNTLRVQGCVLGFLCGGEDWQRVTGNSALAATIAKAGGRTSPIAKAPENRVCSEVLRRH